MQAFFVHDPKKETDLLIIPQLDVKTSMDRQAMETFIGVQPDFSNCSGASLNGLPPDAFGHVVATRDPKGDVCIVDESLWQQRMASILGSP